MFRPMLREGSVDFVITNMALGFQDEEFDISQLCTFETVFGIRSSYSWTGPIQLAQLLEMPWVLLGKPSTGGGSNFLEDLLATYNLPPPKRVIHCDALTIALGMMARADIVGFFSKRLADQEFARHGLVQLPLVETIPRTAISLVSNRNGALSLTAQHLVDILKRSTPN